MVYSAIVVDMVNKTDKFGVSITARTFGGRRAARPNFYELAKKHIVKGKKGGPRDLSLRIDEIAYGT